MDGSKTGNSSSTWFRTRAFAVSPEYNFSMFSTYFFMFGIYHFISVIVNTNIMVSENKIDMLNYWIE